VTGAALGERTVDGHARDRPSATWPTKIVFSRLREREGHGLKGELDRRFARIEEDLAQAPDRRIEVGTEVHGKSFQETLSDGLSKLMAVVASPIGVLVTLGEALIAITKEGR
jgi:hypothetical protein